jgi:uncharacterized protein YqeY
LIPHVAIATETGEVTRVVLDDLIRRALEASAAKPCAIEVFDAATQRFLFLREGQIYAAAEIAGGQMVPGTIRDFLTGSTHMNFPRAVLFELNARILHSLLVVAQKKPALRVMTNLIDLDEMAVIAELSLPGRPRWALYDEERDLVYANIRDPAEIAVIERFLPQQMDEAAVEAAVAEAMAASGAKSIRSRTVESRGKAIVKMRRSLRRPLPQSPTAAIGSRRPPDGPAYYFFPSCAILRANC